MKKLICSLMVGTMMFGLASSVAGAVPYKKRDKGLIARIVERNRERNRERNLKENLINAIKAEFPELFASVSGSPIVSGSPSGSGSPDSSIMEDAIAMLSPIRPRVRRSSIMGDGASVDGGESSIMGDGASFDEGGSSIMR